MVLRFIFLKLNKASRLIQPWAFESRDFLRALAVGKEISFTSTHSLPPNDDVPRDFGTAEIGGLDIASELLKSGWAKIKELKRDLTDEDLKRKDLEAEAKAAGKGLWNPHGPQVCCYFMLRYWCNFLILLPCHVIRLSTGSSRPSFDAH
jgi:staphylococcal nuclease domain-containing protein 1